jgi:hypothetical protein
MNNKSSVRECRWMVSRESEQRAAFNQNRFSIRRILAPTDLTSAESGVIDYAVAFSRRVGAELIMLHVHEAKGSGGLFPERDRRHDCRRASRTR